MNEKKRKKRYPPFSDEEREIIEKCLNENINMILIAEKLNRSYPGIKLEIYRNGGLKNYTAEISKKNFIKRKLERKNAKEEMIKEKKIFVSYFTKEERILIEQYIHEGLNLYQISKKLNRSYSGIKAEVRRNGGIKEYTADKAIKSAICRLQSQGKHYYNYNDAEKLKLISELMEQQVPNKEIVEKAQISFYQLKKFKRKILGFDVDSDIELSNLPDRVAALEMQLEIILDMIKEIKNQKF